MAEGENRAAGRLRDFQYSTKDSWSQGTDLASAQCTTIRLKLLKIGAQVQVTVRRVWFRMAGGYAYAEAFAHVYANLQKIPLMRC
jgi:hypothetical protein